MMNAQEKSIASLEREGYRFSNWIPAQPDANNEPAEDTEAQQTAVMVKRTRSGGNAYREVEADGTIN